MKFYSTVVLGYYNLDLRNTQVSPKHESSFSHLILFIDYLQIEQVFQCK